MVTGLSEIPVATFNPAISAPGISKVGFVGGGDVLQKKFFPALKAGDYKLERIAVCSLEPQCRLNGLPYLYQQVESGCLLPLEFLDEQGLLGSDTLWIIATPPEYHIAYAEQLAWSNGRIAVEKPIAASSRQARLLLTLSRYGREIYPINHKLFNASALEFVDFCRRQAAVLEKVRRIRANFYEAVGIDTGRQPDDTIADIQYHLFTIIIALFKAAVSQFEISVDRVQASSHTADPQGRFQTPSMRTASRIQGRLFENEREIAFDFRQAKGAPRDEKFIRLFDARGELVKEIDLNESGHHAHARVLRALLQPTVDMRHTLADAVIVMDLIDSSRIIAYEESPYAFGELPDFLRE
jgi:predicted dehydrogenase